MDVQAAPIRAWRAAKQQERLASGDKSDRPLAVAREIKVPQLASRAGAQVQGTCREGPVTGPTLGHCRDTRWGERL
eukprot:12494805-Alexandrium_andersonii.AAC.1